MGCPFWFGKLGNGEIQSNTFKAHRLILFDFSF